MCEWVEVAEAKLAFFVIDPEWNVNKSRPFQVWYVTLLAGLLRWRHSFAIACIYIIISGS